ncbi:MAG: DUF5060 domain-containing protein [Myxococcota bacterium]
MLLTPSCVGGLDQGSDQWADHASFRASVEGLWIVDADTNTDVRMLIDGETLALDQLPAHWTLRSEHTNSPGQVCFDVNGVREKCEGVAPYAIAGDSSGNYNPWDPPLGDYTIEASADGGAPLVMQLSLVATGGPACDNGIADGDETDVDCGGSCTPCADGSSCLADADCENGNCDAGTCAAPPPPPPPPPGDGLVLVDAASDLDVGPVLDGDTLYEDDLPASWTLRAELSSSPGQVCFDVDGVQQQCEGFAPYSISGDSSGDFAPWGASVGNYSITVRTDGVPAFTTDFTVAPGSEQVGHCDNGVTDGDETDVDCGGSCSGCAPGSDCTVDSDCASGQCSPGGQCEAPPPFDCQVLGTLERWHRVEVRCTGPQASEGDDATFTDHRMSVTFTQGGSTYVVPGHFAADGNAANSGATSGTQWRAYFMPPATGTWDYTVSMRTGSNIAVDPSPTAGSPVAGLDGAQDSFSVAPSSKTGRDMRARGLLAPDPNERYLRFAGTGAVYVEGGVDSPENLLGYSGFDNTVKYDNVGSCKGILHDFAPHQSDWNPGDPSWDGGRGQSLIGLVNYVANTGVNAMYMVPMSVNGDGCDGHPWTEYFGNRRAFDVSKLDQWEIVFGHMTARGLMIHYVTQETENDQLLNGGALGFERQLYYREIISRFGHHPALQWNLGEENTNTAAQERAFADFIKATDPYDHPVVMHTYPGQHGKYNDLLGYSTFDGPTLQYGSIPQSASGGLYGATLGWIADSAAAGPTWVVTATEASGGQAPTPNTSVTPRQRTYWMWANVMAGGGGFEWYLKNGGAGHAYDLAVEDLREFDEHWQQSGHVVEFFRDVVQGEGVELTQLQANNGLTGIGTDWVLADPGSAYILYLREGGSVSLSVSGGGTYAVSWFDPRTGALTDGPDIGGNGTQNLGSPPSATTQDWVVFVRR